MTTADARSLINAEADFVRIDGQLTDLMRHVELTGVADSGARAREVRKARRLLRKTLWALSGSITEAVHAMGDSLDEVPF